MAMRAFLGLLIVNALVAIAAILGATGNSDWQVVGTTLLLTAGCLTIAANAAALERDRLMQLPYVGASERFWGLGHWHNCFGGQQPWIV